MVHTVTTRGPLSQGTFLENMGLRLRLSQLLENAKTDERRSALRNAAERLVNRTGMGAQYQVMAITSTGGDIDIWPFVQMEKTMHQQ